MMNILQKFLTITFLAASIFISGLNVDFVGAQNTALEPVTIQLRWFHQFQFAGYYAAIEKGFYAEEGLDVSLLEFNPKEGRVAPVLAGKAQYGVGDPVLMKLRAEGKPVVVLAQILQHTPQVLITKRDSGIFGPESLAGKRVMVIRDDIGSAPIQLMILETLGSLDSVEFVTHSYRYEDLLEGSVDAISAYRSNEPFRMKQQGVDVNIIDPRSYGIDFYGDNLFTTDKEIIEHHERAEKVVRATLKGWEYALKHKDEIIQLIRQTYAPALSLDQLRYEAKVIDQMIVPDLIAIGDINPKRYERIAEIYHRLGMLKKAEIPAGFLHGPREHMVDLTPEEQAWLKAHPDITFGFADEYEPFLIKGADGNLSGILIDFLNQMNVRLGTQFTPEGAPWGEILEKVGRKELAGTLTMTPMAADAWGLLKTETQFNIYPAIFARSDAPFTINGLDDLRGRSVAIIDPSHFSEKILEPLGGEVVIKKIPDDVKLMQMVYEGKVDAVLTVTAHNYILAKYGFSGVRPVYTFWDQPIPSLMGVRPDWPELVSILNKGIASFSQEEINALMVKWINAPVERSPSLMFTEAEKAWVERDHTVQVRVTDHAPYLYSKDGEPVGIAVDLINAVSERTGIKFHFVMPSPPFSADLKGLIQHEGPDVITSLNPTPEREKVILFTKPYVSTPRFIFTRDDAEFVASMENLSGKTVAVIKGYLVHKELAKNYPDINLLFCKNNEDALRAVSFGKAFAFIGGLLSTPIMINKFGLNNLKASAPSSLSGGTVAMGIRSDWPELRDIINKVFDSIPESEKTAIVNKWSSVKVEYGIRPADVLKWILVVVGAAFGILLLFVFWNRSLTKQVKERTGEIERSNESLGVEISERKRSEETLQKSTSQLLKAQRIGKIGFVEWDLKTNKMQWSDEIYQMLRIDRKKVTEPIFESLFNLVHPDDRAYVQENLHAAVKDRSTFNLDSRMVCPDGTEIWTSTQAELILDHDGAPVNLRGVIQDITERKQMEEAIKQSEERYRGLSEAAFEAIFISEKGVCLEQNTTAEKMFGYTFSEAIGRKGTEWIAPEDREMVMNNMLSGYEKPYEVTALRKNGSTFQAEIQARMMNYKGRVVRVTALIDITERKQMERALRESEEKFRTLVTNTEEIVYMVNKDGTFLLSEGKGLSKLGLKPGQIVGKSVFELYKDYPQMLAEMRKAFNGETVTTEINVDGNYFRNWYTPHKNHEGEIIGLLGLSVNITEQKEAEGRLQEYQQRLKALAFQLTITEEKERRHIAADLHDNVGQSLALARMQLASARKSASEPKLADKLDDISDTLLETLEDTQQLMFELSPPSMNELGLSAAIPEWLEEQIGNRHSLKTEFIDNILDIHRKVLDPNVRAILFRSVRELLINVVKHARANKVRVRLEDKNSSLKIIVEDDGIGFDPRAAIRASGKIGGFGLFSIEERMADLGGNLKIVSEPGKGCTVILSAPFGVDDRQERDKEME